MTPIRRLGLIALAALTAGVTLAGPAPATTDAALEEQMTFFARVTVPGSATPPPIGPLQPSPGTTITNVYWTFPATNDQGQTCATFDVSPETGWEVAIMRNMAPLWGSSTAWITNLGGGVVGVDAITFSSPAPHPKVELCTSGNHNPPVDATRFEVTQGDTTASTETGKRACFPLTIRGVLDPDYPFFFGWDAVLNLNDAITAFDDNGWHATHVELPHQGEWFNAGPVDMETRTMTITSTTAGSIRTDQVREITPICLVGW